MGRLSKHSAQFYVPLYIKDGNKNTNVYTYDWRNTCDLVGKTNVGMRCLRNESDYILLDGVTIATVNKLAANTDKKQRKRKYREQTKGSKFGIAFLCIHILFTSTKNSIKT